MKKKIMASLVLLFVLANVFLPTAPADGIQPLGIFAEEWNY